MVVQDVLVVSSFSGIGELFADLDVGLWYGVSFMLSPVLLVFLACLTTENQLSVWRLNAVGTSDRRIFVEAYWVTTCYWICSLGPGGVMMVSARVDGFGSNFVHCYHSVT